jgi:hypothetical protein
MPESKRLLLAMFVVVLLMGVTSAFAEGVPAPPGDVQAALASVSCPQQAPNLDPALSCPATAPAVPAAEFMLNKKLGYCHCGCGPATCHTSDDCGGASCDPFPSCC